MARHTVNRQWIGDDNYFHVVLPESWGIQPKAEVAAAQLSDMPWIMHHPGTSDAVVIERLFASCNLHPRVVAYSDDFNASLEMASAGLGAALVPELALRYRPERIVVLDVPEIRLARNISRCSSMRSRRPRWGSSWTFSPASCMNWAARRSTERPAAAGAPRVSRAWRVQ